MSFASKLKRNLKEYRRVLSIARKPSKDEFLSILKLTGIGISIMGVVGFVIQLFYQFVISGVL